MTRETTPLILLFVLVTAAPVLAESSAPQGSADGDLQELSATLERQRSRNARDYAITSPNGIEEGRYVELGGIEQWITIRGDDRDNPVVLFVHGGPGDATNPWGYAAFRSWLKHFTVVQWDQRGAGRTLGRNGPSLAPTITPDRIAQDGVELAELLREYLGKNRVVLVAHSFGSIFGTMMVKSRPDLFYAYVGTGQIADPAQSYSVAHRALVRKAESLNETQAVEELREVGPPPYADGRGFAVQRKWANIFEGADFLISSMVGFALRAPGYTIGDINDWMDGQILSANALIPQTIGLTASALGGDFAVPVFVIQGAEDFTSPTSLARIWVESIRAPDKAFVPLEGSGHFAVFMKPDSFLEALVGRVLPLVSAR